MEKDMANIVYTAIEQQHEFDGRASLDASFPPNIEHYVFMAVLNVTDALKGLA